MAYFSIVYQYFDEMSKFLVCRFVGEGKEARQR